MSHRKRLTLWWCVLNKMLWSGPFGRSRGFGIVRGRGRPGPWPIWNYWISIRITYNTFIMLVSKTIHLKFIFTYGKHRKMPLGNISHKMALNKKRGKITFIILSKNSVIWLRLRELWSVSNGRIFGTKLYPSTAEK